MVRLLYASRYTCLFCFLLLLIIAPAVQADPPLRPTHIPVTAVPPDQQRYLMYTFYNAGYYGDPNFTWAPIETALANGFNGIMLAVPWDQIYPTRNGPANWATLDQEIARITGAGAKVGLLIGVHRDLDRVDTFWPAEGFARTYKNEILYKQHAYQFSPAHQPTLDLATDFVRQVAQRYNSQQQQGQILFMSVTNSPIMEQEYSSTSMILYQGGENNTVLDYSQSMITGFRTWLAAKYSTVGALNTAWGSTYASFDAVQPPGLLASDIAIAFFGKPGKDWYSYRHKVHKAFVDQTTKAIKSVNSTYKVINQHGSVFDNFSVYRGTLGFNDYAMNTDGVKVNDAPDYLHRFSMDLLRSNLSADKWVMNELDGQSSSHISVQTYLDQITQCFTHGAKVLTFANFADANGIALAGQLVQQIRAQGWLDQPVPAFKPNGTIRVKLTDLVSTGYNQLGIPYQWVQLFNQNGNQPVRIIIDDDLLGTATTPPSSTTTAPPTPVSSLSIVTPALDCATGVLTYKTAGGDGTPIDYMVVGQQPWGATAAITLTPAQRIGTTFTLKARQSGNEISLTYTTTCVNQPPVLVAPIPSQTLTQGVSFSYVIPVTTFTDPDGQLTAWSVSNLPPGLTFDPATRTVSGAPTVPGSFTVTLAVTDNLGAMAQTPVVVKVVAPATPPVSTTTPVNSLSLLSPSLTCGTGILTFKTAGGDNTSIEYMVVGLTTWSTQATVKIDPLQRRGTTYTLKARQSGNEVTYSYVTACPNQPPVLITPVAAQTITQGTSYSFVIPITTFADSDGVINTWAVSGLPAGLTYNAATRTISGSPTTTGITIASLIVTDNGGASAQQKISLTVVSPPLVLLAPGFDCATGRLTLLHTGGDGTSVEYRALGVKDWSADSVLVIVPWQRDGVTFTLQARQSGKQATFTFKTSCATNQPPVVVTPIPNQTAILARTYSFLIPASTFADPDGQLVAWRADNLPVGLTFDAATHTISGTPALIGPGVITVTVTDNGGASVQTSFILQVLGNNSTATTPPPAGSPLVLLAPGFDCATGRLVFHSSGGDGTPVEYFAVGIKTWSADSVGTIDPWQRDGVTFTLQARQSGKQATFTFKTSCATNQPPVVVTPIPNQTAILARTYSFLIPASTFADPDGQLVAWRADNLPVGLTFDAATHTISGTPALIGPGVITVTVTDNGGASVQTSFILQVLGNNSTATTPPPAGSPLVLLAPGFDCATGRLVFHSSGGDGTSVEYFAVGIKTWSADSVGTIDPWQRDGVTFTLQARQSGKQATFTFKTSCATNQPPVVVTPIPNQTAILARTYSFLIPASTFADPDGQLVAWRADNLPVGLTFDAATHTISGTPALIGPGVITVTVTDNGGASVQTSFILQVLGNNSTATAPPPAGSPLVLLAPGFDCATGRLVFHSSGGDGTPVEYTAIGLKNWNTDTTALIETWQRNGVVFTLKARQSGTEVTYSFTTACGATPTPVSATTAPAAAAPPTITTLVISSPQSRIVYQRNQANQANIALTGQAPGTATRAEARLVPVADGQGTLLDWTNVPLSDGNVFATRLTHVGGWYRLEVRAWNGTTLLGQQTVDRVGIGEVFVVAGQSNAYGGFEVRPGASDDRVSCVDYLDGSLNEALLPVRFSHMDISVTAGPNNPKHIWPELGDKLTSRLNVPVLFLGAAQSSTSSDEWRQSAGEADSYSPDYFPYRRLGATLLHYIARTGARAVLWHQGEGDQGNNTQRYVDNLTAVINKSRQQSGNSVLPWVMSRVSYVQGVTDANVINAQNRLINEVAQVYPGPATDVLGPEFRLSDNVHIAGAGAVRFVEMWDQSLTTDFFSRSTPFTVDNSPQITTGYVVGGPHLAGQSLQVPYVVSGAPSVGGSFAVQLIRDADGSVAATLGSGQANPLTVTLPASLANGMYRARVVSGNLTAQAGEPFRVGPSGGRVASPETRAGSWQVWPNPVEHELTVAVPPSVTIANLRVVLSTVSGLAANAPLEPGRIDNGQLHLTLPALATGLYFLHIYDGDQPLQTLKVLKK